MNLSLRLGAIGVALAIVGGACADADRGGAPPAATATAVATADERATPTPAIAPTPTEPPQRSFGVGRIETTFVDASRVTPASGDWPGSPTRELDTLIWYPTADASVEEVVNDGLPAVGRGPFPLIVFAHGLGGSPDVIEDLAAVWARAGFVVAAPWFPLTRSDAPNRPDASDVQNQPGDISFLISELAAESGRTRGTLSQMVEATRVGVAGHSNGAITTLGLVAHSCCADTRVDAAISMAGTASPLAGGDYRWTTAPPLLVVHGTADALVNYQAGVSVFNSAVGPKGLLTIRGGSHGEWLLPSDASFNGVAQATTDFFLAYLDGDDAALGSLEAEPATGPVDLVFVAEAGSDEQVPTASDASTRTATADIASELVDGQAVTVTWSGFIAGGTVNVVQCSGGGVSGASFCDLTSGRILMPNPDGSGSVTISIVTGEVGQGACEPDSTDCVIVVNDSGLPDPDASVLIPLSFAG